VRRIIVWTMVSLDGYVEGPDRELDWHQVDAELHAHFNAELSRMSVFLDGRVVHELMADYWPTADEEPDAPPEIVEYAQIWRDMPKIVFSSTSEDTRWNTSVRRSIDVEEIRALKAQPGGDMPVGGATLAREFLRLGLVDELRLYVNPVLLGRGRPLLPVSGSVTPLVLLETHAFTHGVVMLRYAVGT